MGEEDKTRQSIKKPGDDDEVFEVGDSSIMEKSSGHKLAMAAAKPSPLPWVLVVLLAAGAAAAAWLYVLPQKDQLGAAQTRATTLSADNDALKEKLQKAEEEQKSLAGRAAELEDSVQKKEAALKELLSTKEELESKLKDEISHGDVLVKQHKGELIVDLVDQILFPSGEAELNEKGKEVLKKVGETMLKVPDKVMQIGGHTDNQPISPKLKTTYPSNWELSTTRALNVVHFLQDDVKVPGERLAVAGFAEFQPTAKNSSKDGRKKNRRIEIVLLTARK